MRIHWPNGRSTWAAAGTDWLQAAREASCFLPTGCLGGNCGACEITVNGEPLRACLAVVPACPSGDISVELWADPAW